jgi:hypothetical protein
VTDERLTAKQADALREELAELEGPAPHGGRRRDQEGARVRRPVRELRVPRGEERAGPARGAHPHAAARLDHAEIVEQRPTTAGRHRLDVEIEDDGGETMTVEISAVGGSGTVSPTSPLGVRAARRARRRHRRGAGAARRWKATIRAIRSQ